MKYGEKRSRDAWTFRYLFPMHVYGTQILCTKRARLDRFRDYAKIICMTMKYNRLLDSLTGRPKKCTPALKNRAMGKSSILDRNARDIAVDRSLQRIQFPLLIEQNLTSFSSSNPLVTIKFYFIDVKYTVCNIIYNNK